MKIEKINTIGYFIAMYIFMVCVLVMAMKIHWAFGLLFMFIRINVCK